MSGETKEVFGSNYGQNDVIINGLIDKMTLFDDNLMSLVFGQNIETTELLLRVIMERDIKVIDVRGQDELKNPVIGGRCITLDVHEYPVSTGCGRWNDNQSVWLWYPWSYRWQDAAPG